MAGERGPKMTMVIPGAGSYLALLSHNRGPFMFHSRVYHLFLLLRLMRSDDAFRIPAGTGKISLLGNES